MPGSAGKKTRKAALAAAGTLALVYFSRPTAREIIGLSVPIALLLAYGFSGWATKGRLSIVEKIGRSVVILLACVGCVSLYASHFWPEPPAAMPVPALVPISFRLGCEWDHIPIQIPAASTIHVIRVHPGLLRANPNILDLGVFQDISSTPTAALDWPSERDGRWMTRTEIQKLIADKKGFPTPLAFRCTLSSYGAVTLDEIVVPLLVDTPDGKRHSYPIAFDPLMSGHTFSFYVVSACSSGVTPTLVQWDDYATVRVLGEQKTRRVALRYEKRNWPSQLLSFQGSNFVWNGLENCQWDEKQ